MRLKKICFGVTILLQVLISSGLAQETTGGIQGTVKDPQGAVIPGATVEVTSTTLIGKKTATTDSGGFFHFEQLPPGTYSISVNVPGFAPQTQGNLELRVGALPTVTITMQVGGITQEVSVSAEAAVIDITQSKVQTTVDEEVLTTIPKLRSFQSVIPFAPGARQEPMQSARDSRIGGFQINGASDSENVYMIDGVNATDVQNGGVGKDFQTDFIQEIQIKSSSFEAEFGGALGGVVNAVPKRGSNAWHGELKGYYQSAALNATDPCGSGFTASQNTSITRVFGITEPSGFAGITCGLRANPATALNTTARLDAAAEYYIPRKDDRHIVEPGYEVGGPLLTDRLWAFSSYIPTLDSTQRTTVFRCPPSNPNCSFAGPRRLGQSFVQHNAYNRLDYRASDRLRLFGSWNYAYGRVTGQLANPDSAVGQTNTGATIDPTTLRSDFGVVNPLSIYSFGGDYTPTSSLLVNARYGYYFSNLASRGTPSGIRYIYDRDLNQATRDVNNNPFPATAPFNTRGFSNIPGNFARFYDAFKRKSFNSDLSYFTGKLGGNHNFKIGYFWSLQRNDVLRTANTAVVDLNWGIDYTPVTSTTACAAIQATNASGRCMGQYGYFFVGSETVSNTGFADATDQAFYLQDSWTVGSSGLTINAGVRFDHEHNPAFDPKRFPDINFGWADKIAPRIGGAYDLVHNGKVKLYASYGKFFDIMKLGLTRGSFGSDYWHECHYALDTVDFTSITPTLTTGAGCPPSGPAPGVNARFIENVDFRATKADPRDPAVQANMKPVQSDVVTAGADLSLTPNLVLEARYTRNRLISTIEDMSITDNLGFYIGNPGTRFADVLHRPTVIPNDAGVEYLNTTPFCAECPGVVKPIRRYDGVEFRLTRKGGARWYGTVSYTYSKLRGNYSGLVDTDPTDGNGGRHSPNNGRAFDLPTMTYLASGKIDDGPLATDRPHTAKVWGYYRLPWLGQETSFSVSQALYQGTPISSCLPVVGTSSACQWAEGRGNFARLHREPNGTIVKDGVIMKARSDPYLQTDIAIRHQIRVSKDNENYKFVIEGNAYNLFNQHAATSYYQFVVPTNLINPTRPKRFSGDPRTDWAKVMNGYNYIDALNGTGAFGGAAAQPPLTLANRYGLPQTFQIARQFRFAVRFIF
jgi:Carboxypeptidase regulatory-like domain/TonB-dependent Receptor Plug Domain